MHFFLDSHTYMFLAQLTQTPRTVRFTYEKMQAATTLGALKGQETFPSPLDATNMPGSKRAFSLICLGLCLMKQTGMKGYRTSHRKIIKLFLKQSDNLQVRWKQRFLNNSSYYPIYSVQVSFQNHSI